MVKFEVVYSGSKRKISLSDGRVLVMTDGRKFLMPMQDWYSTFSKTENFKLATPEGTEDVTVVESEEMEMAEEIAEKDEKEVSEQEETKKTKKRRRKQS